MYRYKIWNKEDDINGVKSNIVIKSHNIKDSDEIFLVINSASNRVMEIQFKDIICSNYNINANLTCDEVAQEYLKIKEEEKQQAEKEVNTIEDIGNKISILEQENQALREELTQIQTSIASLMATTLEEK